MANLFLIWPSVLPSVRFFNISIPLPSVFSFTLCWGPKFCNPQLCEARPAWLIFNSTHTLVDFQPPPHVFASLNAKGCSILKCWGARDGETFYFILFFGSLPPWDLFTPSANMPLLITNHPKPSVTHQFHRGKSDHLWLIRSWWRAPIRNRSCSL